MADCYLDPNSTLSWDSLFPYVTPWVRGAPTDLMAHHIRMSCINFCRVSGILHDVQTYDLQAYVQDYYLTTECDYEINDIVRVTIDKRWTYTPVNFKLPAGVGAYLVYADSPTHIVVRRPPAIDDPQGLEVETTVKPKQDSCVLDNYLYQNWAEGIAEGAIASLLSIPQTNWFDRKESNEHQKLYRREITRARAYIDRSFQQRTVMRGEQFVGPGNRGWGTGGGYWGGGVC